MANYKLQIDDFETLNYNIIAIHSHLEDYRLAYFINKNLPINLCKSKNEILINTKEGETHFSRFEFNDEENEISWNLIQNETEINSKKTTTNLGLFAQTNPEIYKKIYLLPEFKKVDFFLKIEHDENLINLEEITSKLNLIDNISTVYNINYNKIKNKNNLIF